MRNLHWILSHVVSVKFTVEILENFMSFSEYMNFKNVCKSAELETVYVFTVYDSKIATIQVRAEVDNRDIIINFRL